MIKLGLFVAFQLVYASGAWHVKPSSRPRMPSRIIPCASFATPALKGLKTATHLLEPLRSAMASCPLLTFASGVAVGMFIAPRFPSLSFSQYLTAEDIPAKIFRSKKTSLSFVVVKCTDGDTYRLRHLPLFSALRRGKLSKAEGGDLKLSDSTIALRICAVDTPETAKFGSKGQDFGDAGTTFASDRILGKRVRVTLLARDQYQRCVGALNYRTGPFGLIKRDISKELLKNGLATVYRQAGGEYNDMFLEDWIKLEDRAKSKKVGMWGSDKALETPAEYKKRMKEASA